MPRVSWQVRLSLLYLWYAAAIGRSWTGRAPVGSAAKSSAWREVTHIRSPQKKHGDALSRHHFFFAMNLGDDRLAASSSEAADGSGGDGGRALASATLRRHAT